jgi:hypothetical protein
MRSARRRARGSSSSRKRTRGRTDPTRHGVPHGTVSRTARYPARHGILHGTVARFSTKPRRCCGLPHTHWTIVPTLAPPLRCSGHAAFIWGVHHRPCLSGGHRPLLPKRRRGLCPHARTHTRTHTHRHAHAHMPTYIHIHIYTFVHSAAAAAVSGISAVFAPQVQRPVDGARHEAVPSGVPARARDVPRDRAGSSLLGPVPRSRPSAMLTVTPSARRKRDNTACITARNRGWPPARAGDRSASRSDRAEPRRRASPLATKPRVQDSGGWVASRCAHVCCATAARRSDPTDRPWSLRLPL